MDTTGNGPTGVAVYDIKLAVDWDQGFSQAALVCRCGETVDVPASRNLPEQTLSTLWGVYQQTHYQCISRG